ncbi:tRNA lysidine(34) synthetase TilS [Pseudidiomarina andamanensis]|uniref:tRNA(Ile)-lysidine synthase n=1 Tax=Pseudidiomarina andamanensis TaxID=1940690 RepID=A0AA92ETR2_9GAMM|nr:tRNA lysidine(34) synthetase TilS [Pseudidiomarina andamanensis]MDS0218662.1 tRNA lysidine(34) synthetase TilS [Pseudidiomarina andamanensis]QGT95526.1 tRNA lysidine(34) synthetase TilS [Pseudidiomarina andamanensis]
MNDATSTKDSKGDSGNADPLYTLFKQRLLATKLEPRQQIIVCLGGGADSQTVLDLTDQFRHEFPQFNYLAVHLDHAFHPSSGAWAQGLVDDCQRRNFPMICEPLHVASGSRISKEAAGREARYQRLSEIAEADALFLLGQHRNDQIETFLLQLKRGAGPKGLAAMAMHSYKGDQSWLRPLLDVSKEDIYRYAHAHQLFWVEDDTNYDTSIERNFLRHEVVPKLEERWPHFGQAVLRSAQLCSETQQLMEELLEDRVKPHIDSHGNLATRWLQQASEQLQRGVLRYWLQTQQAAIPSFAQLEQLRTQMLLTTNDANPCVEWANCSVQRMTADNKDRLLVLTKKSRWRV